MSSTENMREGSFRIIKILYPKNRHYVEDDFCIFIAQDKYFTQYKFKANKITLEELHSYMLRYEEKYDKKYGQTNDVIFYAEDVNLDSLDGIRNMLNTITSITITNNIIKEFGENVFDILDNENIEALMKVKNIGNVTSLKIIKKYKEIRHQKEFFLKLGKYGFSYKQMEKIVNYFGGIMEAVDGLNKNLYNIMNIEGFNFKNVDKIALQNGYAYDDYRRLVSAVIYCFNKSLEMKGWSYLSYNQLINVFNGLSIENMNKQQLEQALKFMLDKKIARKTGSDEYYSLQKIYDIEQQIKEHLIRISKNNVRQVSNELIESRLNEIEKSGTILSFEQKQFIINGANDPFICLTGSAGSGKTFTIASLLKVLDTRDDEVYGLALSGRAASNLQDSIAVTNCTTIHKVIIAKQTKGDEYINFIKAKVVILDEATMVSGDLFLRLLKEIGPNVRFIVMGDIKQLPPIGNCQIYHDILMSKYFSTYTLTKLFRQQGDSQIIPLSKAIADGDYDTAVDKFKEGSFDISRYTYSEKNMINGYLKELATCKYNLMDVQTCLATNMECYNFNKVIHQTLIEEQRVDARYSVKKMSTINGKQQETEFAIGDKVINTCNIYNGLYDTNGKKATCMNGEMGIIKNIVDERYVVVTFIQNKKPINIFMPFESLEWGYACTCHKLQGSGFDSVIIGLSESVYSKLYTREWLYTAVTRVKKQLCVYSSTDLFVNTIKQCETNQKQTLLEAMLVLDTRII